MRSLASPPVLIRNFRACRLEAQIAAAASERAQVTKRREAATAKAAEAREQIESHRSAARAARERSDELAALLSEKNDEHQEAIAAQGKASRALSDGRLELAMTSERRANLKTREKEARTSRERP